MAAVPEPIEEDPATGVVSGDALARARAGRPTDQRIAHVEWRLDGFGDRIGKVEVVAAGLVGEMKVVPELVTTMREATKAMQERQTLVFTAQVDVAKKQAIAKIDDSTDAAKHRRKRWSQILGLVASGGGLWEIIHRLFL